MAITVERLEAQITADPAAALAGLAAVDAAIDAVARNRTAKVDVDVEMGGAATHTALAESFQMLESAGKELVSGLANVGEALSGVGKLAGTAQQATSQVGEAMNQASKQAGGLGQALGDAWGTISKIGGWIGQAVGMLSSIGMAAGVFALVYTGATVLTGAIQALAGAIGALVAIVGSLAGLLGTLPVLFGAVGAAALTLFAGLNGIQQTLGLMTQAQNKSTQSTYSAAAAARELKSARQGIVDANKAVIRAEQELARATEMVAEARKQAAKDIVEQRRTVRDAIWAEEDAVDRVRRAQENLAKVQARVGQGAQNVAKETDYFTGKVYEVARASSSAVDDAAALRDAQHDLVHAQEDLTRATENRTDAQSKLQEMEKAGVEGSQKVIDALRRQEDAANALSRAHDNVAAAIERLKRVQEEQAARAAGGAAANSALAAAMKKLSPAGREFVKFLHDEFMPEWDNVQKKAQEGLLPGVQAGLKQLIDSGFFKMIGDQLKLFGEGLGGAFKDLTAWLSSPQMQASIKDMGKLFREVLFGTFKDGKQQTKGLVDAIKPLTTIFLSLTKAAGPATKQLVDLLVTGLEKISTWMEKPENQKAMSDFFESGVEMLKLLIPLLVPLGQIFVDIVKAATPLAKDLLKDIAGWLKTTADDLNKPGGMKKLQKFFDDMKPLIEEFGGVLKDLFVTLFTVPAGGKESPFVALMKGLREQVIPALGELLSIVSKDPKAASDLMAFIGGVIRALNWFIEHRSQIALISPGLNAIRLSIWAYKGLSSLFDWFHEKWTAFWKDVNVVGIGGAIEHAVQSVLQTTWRAFANGMNWVIEQFNKIPFLPDIPWRVPIAIGGGAAHGMSMGGGETYTGPTSARGTTQASAHDQGSHAVRAGGGNVQPGRQYVVGENRPELLTLAPGGGGTITSKLPSGWSGETQEGGHGMSADELDRILTKVLEKAKPNVDMEVNVNEHVDPKLLADEIAWSIR